MPEENESGASSGGSNFTPPASQEELNRIIEQRLARERGKFADYDDLKAKAAKFDEADAASKSELQKALDQIAERDAKIADLPRQIRGQVLRFASAATARGFLDPEDALAFLPSDLDVTDEPAVKAALDELADRKPHLLRQEKPKPKPAGRASAPGDKGDGDKGEKNLEGKERAAAALRAFAQTRP